LSSSSKSTWGLVSNSSSRIRISLSGRQKNQVSYGFGASGGQPSLLELFFLADLGYRHQRPQVIIPFVSAAGQNEHYADRVRGMRKVNAVNGAGEQDIKFLLAFDYYVRYCKARLDHRSAFRFAVQELL
jgi:hypothetical protein